jgi:hypothetical protein
MSILLGYRIKSNNIMEVEQILRAAKARIGLAATEAYHRFLSDEICELVDNITLGVMSRPNCPILDVAVQNLNQRISNAEATSNGTEYDLRSNVSIIPDGKYTYFILRATNPDIQEAFADIPEIEDYTIDEKDINSEIKSKKVEKWQKLQRQSTEKPIILSAMLTTPVSVDTNLLSFKPPLERAETRARWQMTARLLNQYACGREITSDKLLPLLDKSLERLLTEEMTEAQNEMVRQLTTTLINIKLDLVLADPNKPDEPDEPEEPSNSDE